MPRPTRPQVVYGSAAVVLSTAAMLLLSQARSGVGVAAVAVTGLALGVLAALAAGIPVSARFRTRSGVGEPAPAAVPPARVRATAAEAREHSLQP
jgi:hypothetical protein